MRSATIFFWGLATACGGGGSAEVSGSIEGTPFTEVAMVFHGGPHVVLVDRKMDCLELAWIAPTYIDGEDPTGGKHDFIAIQFSFETDTPVAGTYSVAPDAPVDGFALVNDDGVTGGTFTTHRARGGFMEIKSVEEETVVGSFEMQFSSDSVTGTFETEYCRNLR